MGQILIKKESLVTLKGTLETLKGEFNTSITDIKTNLLNISNNWEGKKADETLYVIETLNKTNSDLLIRIDENIEYIQEVITTIDKVESVEVETKPVETPLPTASPTPTPTMVPTAIPTASPSDTATIDNVPVISPTQPPPSSIDSNQKLINNIKDYKSLDTIIIVITHTIILLFTLILQVTQPLRYYNNIIIEC